MVSRNQREKKDKLDYEESSQRSPIRQLIGYNTCHVTHQSEYVTQRCKLCKNNLKPFISYLTTINFVKNFLHLNSLQNDMIQIVLVCPRQDVISYLYNGSQWTKLHLGANCSLSKCTRLNDIRHFILITFCYALHVILIPLVLRFVSSFECLVLYTHFAPDLLTIVVGSFVQNGVTRNEEQATFTSGLFSPIWHHQVATRSTSSPKCYLPLKVTEILFCLISSLQELYKQLYVIPKVIVVQELNK